MGSLTSSVPSRLAPFVVSSCDSDDPPAPTFNVEFDAPGGSGLAGGVVSAIGFAPAVPLNFTLRTGVVVNGTVTVNDVLTNGIDVSFQEATGLPDVDGDTTAGAGNYTVTVSQGTWVVVLDGGAALGTTTFGGVNVTGPGPVTLPALDIPTVSVTGTVLDNTGAPVNGVQVRLTGAVSGAVVNVVTNALGQYTATLVPDTYEADVTPIGVPANTLLRQRYPGLGVPFGVTSFTLSPHVLTRGVTIQGTLSLAAVSDIDFDLTAGSVFFPPPDITTDAFGNFTTGLLPPSNTITFDVEPPGASGFPRQLLSVPTGTLDQVGLTLTLQSGFIVTGVVRFSDGSLAEDVEVDATPTDIFAPFPDDDDTDAAGVFEISVFSGTYNIKFVPDPGTNPVPDFPRLLPDVVITQDTNLSVVLPGDVTLPAAATVTGTVSDTGGPVGAGDVRVEVNVPGIGVFSSNTDGAGMYSLLLPVGTHTLNVIAQAGAFVNVALQSLTVNVVTAPGSLANQNITLTAANTGKTVVTGTVFAPGGTVPVAFTDVVARDSATGDVLGQATTDVNGVYTIVIP